MAVEVDKVPTAIVVQRGLDRAALTDPVSALGVGRVPALLWWLVVVRWCRGWPGPPWGLLPSLGYPLGDYFHPLAIPLGLPPSLGNK